MAKRKDVLVEDRVSLAQCKKAVIALLAHATKKAGNESNENELLPRKEENIWLVLIVKKVTPEKKLKPFKIPVAHPIVDPRTSPVCLITKDPQREYKDLLASHNVKFINRVVGITKLKGKFKPFEARRMLLKENGLFLADERVVPLLPQLLGKMFFNAKKQPLPVSLTKKNLKEELEQAISSTYMHQNQGTCTSVKIGTISQPSEHIVDNLKTALPAIAKRIHGGWDNIQSLHIKTNSSTSLPIWTCKLDEGANGRWEASKIDESESWSGLDNDESAEKSHGQAPSREDGEDGEDEEDEEATEVPSQKERGKKRSTKGGESEKPQKKSKAAELPDTETRKERIQKKVNKGTEKKAKVTKGRTSGSIKESITGRKSKSRI